MKRVRSSGLSFSTLRGWSTLVRWTVIVCALGLVMGGVAVAAGAENAKKLVVTGRAELRAEPDMAIFNVGVTTREETLAVAREKNAAALEQVRTQLLALGVDERSLKTKGFNVYPEWHYDRETGQQILMGYQVSHTLEVTVDDLELLGILIDAAIASGANQVSGPTFGLKNTEQLEAAALAEAVRKARSKAEVLARASGTYLKGILHITEQVSTPVGGVARTAFLAMDAAESAATVISPGEVSVTATVTLTYEI